MNDVLVMGSELQTRKVKPPEEIEGMIRCYEGDLAARSWEGLGLSLTRQAEVESTLRVTIALLKVTLNQRAFGGASERVLYQSIAESGHLVND